MTINMLTPLEAKKLIDQGAVVIDIRNPDEYAREHIKGARNVPLATIGQQSAYKPGDIVIYHCKSGMRTVTNMDQLPAEACEAYIMSNGIEGWKAAGLKVEADRSKPIEMMRQVQIAAGSLVVVGVVLGATVHPGFYVLSAFVGAGLVFAGATGTCGMAKILALMPWNRGVAI